MITRLIEFTLRQPLFAALGVVLVIGGGIIAFINLPVEAFPDVTDTQVTVVTLYPGRAAEEVEKQVPQSKERDELVRFIRESKRGIIKPYESVSKEE